MSAVLKPLALALVFIASGCASVVPIPPTALETDVNDKQTAKAAWALVLDEHVNDQGLVDFDAISAQPQRLETWLSFVARVSPRSDPQRFATRSDKLAYYIDAYNALALYGVIRSGVIPAQKLRFFLLRRYAIGGETLSLYALENDLIRPLGDPRIHFALNCMSASCPRLPRHTWETATLDQQLDAAAREFFNDPRHVRVDAEQRTVFLSEILDFFTEDFLAVASSLIDYANRYRQVPIPVDYQVEFIPYDWTVIAQ